MDTYSWFLEASHKIRNPEDRARAEILAGCLLAKQAHLVCVILLGAFVDGKPINVIFVVSFINIICYSFARTRWYRFAALVTIADPIIFITGILLFNIAFLLTAHDVCLVLVLGPMISSVVLSTRTTAWTLILTLILFAAVSFRVDTSLVREISEQALFALMIGALALIAAHLRDKSQKDLELERAKQLQVSKLAAVGELASGIAHELNTPLASIVIYSEFLEEEISSTLSRERLSELTKEIGLTAEQMAEIISKLKRSSVTKEIF